MVIWAKRPEDERNQEEKRQEKAVSTVRWPQCPLSPVLGGRSPHFPQWVSCSDLLRFVSTDFTNPAGMTQRTPEAWGLGPELRGK